MIPALQRASIQSLVVIAHILNFTGVLVLLCLATMFWSVCRLESTRKVKVKIR